MQIKLSKIFVLVDLLIQEVDDILLTPTKDTEEIIEKSKDLQEILIPVFERFYKDKEVRSSTLLFEMHQKFEYNFKKFFQQKKRIKS